MKKTISTVLAVVILAGVFLLTGCDDENITNNGNSTITGIIKDSVTNEGIKDVSITTVPVSYSGIVTDADGRYTITGIAADDYVITAKKPGWFTATYYITVAENETVYADFKMLYSNIFAFDNLTAFEFFNDNSMSAVNLYLGNIVAEFDATNKDIQLRDSVGESERFLFRSGDLALDNPGYETVFGDQVFNGRNFTKYEFDTLSKYYTVDGHINPSRDFPNDRTVYYFPNAIAGNHHVYPFYLKGRYNSNPGNPRVYGLLYINRLFQDSVYKFTVDVKINRNGQNSFSLDQ